METKQEDRTGYHSVMFETSMDLLCSSMLGSKDPSLEGLEHAPGLELCQLVLWASERAGMRE